MLLGQHNDSQAWAIDAHQQPVFPFAGEKQQRVTGGQGEVSRLLIHTAFNVLPHSTVKMSSLACVCVCVIS